MIKVTYYYENLPQAIFNVELDDDTNLDEWETYNKCKIKSWERDGWYQDDSIGGYRDSDGRLVVCEEYGLTDADTDKYSVEVQNGDGYYNNAGKFVYFNNL